MRILLSFCLGGFSLAAFLLSAPAPAHACGGFFCDNSQPVNQAAERIIFSRDSEGAVTALIQIQYSGPSEQFAWMLPVEGTPEISVSSNAAFARLQAATNPVYRLNTTVEGECDDDFLRSSPSASPDAAAGFDAASPGPPVTVLDRGSVGPYDFVVIAVDPDAEDLTGEALGWLTENGYDVSDFGGDMLGLYLEQGMNLLAFRLTKGNEAGSIRPVRLSFGTGVPSIPIRPTAVAATDDMGVMVWVLGEHRAIPANYRHLELNEALINWIRPNSNYNDVVIQAANEAGGQGFVTEMAGEASPLADMIWSDGENANWEDIQATDWTNREGELLDRLSPFTSLDGMRDLFLRYLPVPEAVDEDTFLACIRCYYDYGVLDVIGFEPAPLIEDMASAVIAPMQETAALFDDAPYMTRFYTTMSAHEMTMDPVFDFNSELGDVDNVHVAERVIECSPSVTRADAPYRVSLPNGEMVRGVGGVWPFSVGDVGMPANRRILRVGTEGEGEVIESNVAAIERTLSAHNATVPYMPGSGFGGGSCSAGTAGGGSAAALVLLSLVFLRRRQS